MPAPGYINIPREEYEAILRAIRMLEDRAGEGGLLRRRIRTIGDRIPRVDLALMLESAEDVARLILAIDGKLREFDQEMTPVRPPSHADIRAAFTASVEFAQGKRKPSGEG